MKMPFILSILAATILTNSSLGLAGGRDGGGGVVFVCTEPSGEAVYLADLYKLLKSGGMSFSQEQSQMLSENEFLEVIAESIGKVDSETATTLKKNLRELKFTPVSFVPLLGDDDIQKIPTGCTKAQLAIQYFATNVVEYNESYFAELPPVQRALFKLHEAYVKIYRSNSSTVRGHVAREAASASFEDLLRPSRVVKRGHRSSALAQALSGRVIRCNGRSPSDFFPLTIRASDLGRGKTVIAIETKNGGSFSGSGEFLTVDYSNGQMIFKDGDDDWNELFLNVDPLHLDSKSHFSGIYQFLRDDGGIDLKERVHCRVIPTET